jgi:P-type Cu+ transporter
MIIGGSAQVNSKNQFPSQKKISENSRPSVSSTVPRRVFLHRLAQERHSQRIADDVANYFVPAVIFIAIAAGVGWYFVGVTGATFSLLSFFSAIILALVLVLLVLLVLQH